jgi:hypothetical protein
VTDSILHSPGSENLEAYDIDTISPERYGTERLMKISLRVIMRAVALSRYVVTYKESLHIIANLITLDHSAVLLVQHL